MMRTFLLRIFLFSSIGTFAQSQVHIDVASPKPAIIINGSPCNIGNLVYSCTPKTCNTVIIMEGDSIAFCTFSQIDLMTDSNYYMQWNFNGSANFSSPIFDSFPHVTPICYYPHWDTPGNYTVDIYYNGWLTAYPSSDCWGFGPSHWIIDIVVMQNMGIENRSIVPEITCSIFPNPSEGIFDFKISHPEKVKAIILTDLMGKIIRDVTNDKRIDLTENPSGIYFLNIKAEEGVMIEKIVKE